MRNTQALITRNQIADDRVTELTLRLQATVNGWIKDSRKYQFSDDDLTFASAITLSDLSKIYRGTYNVMVADMKVN